MIFQKGIGSARAWRLVCRRVGIAGAIRLLALNINNKWLNFSRLFKLTASESHCPMYARPRTSDYDVFCQVWVEKQYKPVIGNLADGLVLDLGANVGYSSIYFFTVGKAKAVVAVEPDVGNFSLLENNLRFFGSSVKTINGAVWSHPARLNMVSERYRDGREWARQVSEGSSDHSNTVQAFTIEQILERYPGLRVSLLKMDIEGAESEIFRNSKCPWVDMVDAVAIEFHPDSSFGDGEPYFHNHFTDEEFTKVRMGELLICQRRTKLLALVDGACVATEPLLDESKLS